MSEPYSTNPIALFFFSYVKLGAKQVSKIGEISFFTPCKSYIVFYPSARWRHEIETTDLMLLSYTLCQNKSIFLIKITGIVFLFMSPMLV